MEQFDYMTVPRKILLQAVISELNLGGLIKNDNILVEIQKGVYVLPQDGRIAYDKIINHLKKGGYIPTGQTPGLFKHKTKWITVCLVVDNFGITYENKQDVDDLPKHLNK